MKRVFVAALAAGLLLAACRDGEPERLMPNMPSASTVKEQCDAHDLAYLIGKPRTEIPVAVDPSRRRVSCSTCQMAEDYRPDRTDIIFDSQTGLVMSVTCG